MTHNVWSATLKKTNLEFFLKYNFFFLILKLFPASYPDDPNCKGDCVKTFTSFSAEINVQDYESYVSCMWKIKLLPTRTIEFQFAGDFDLEYHQQCGYDRVHIFSGSVDGANDRQGRFCGPCDGGLPYDGCKRNVEVDGEMNFFTSPYDI